jgi:glycosyltransferase involved in cell wall biosynthesis
MDGLITLIAGADADVACGVTDYTRMLAAALTRQGVKTVMVNATDWSLFGMLRTIRQARRGRTVHLQHPAQALEKQLGPYLLLFGFLGRRRFLTLHEFSRKSSLGKLLTRPLFWLAHRIVVTNEEEKRAIGKYWRPAATKTVVLPIASNIPESQASAGRSTDVIYFGQIRAGRGVEQFVAVVKALPPSIVAKMVGGEVPGDKSGAQLIESARACGIEVLCDRPAEEVAELLSGARVALLPYPDGISERRGSALAAMINGAIVISTPCAPPRPEFESLALLGSSTEQLTELVRLTLADSGKAAAQVSRAREYARQRSWEFVAGLHSKLYAEAG